MKKSIAKKVKKVLKEADKLKKQLIARAADRTAKEESEMQKSIRMNAAVSALVKVVRKGEFDQELQALRKILPRSVRVHVADGKIDVFHDCIWEEVPLQLRFAADYAEQQLPKGMALRTKDLGSKLTKHKIRSNEPVRGAKPAKAA